jgi:hypothetical protein
MIFELNQFRGGSRALMFSGAHGPYFDYSEESDEESSYVFFTLVVCVWSIIDFLVLLICAEIFRITVYQGKFQLQSAS